jgi:poly-gamma-glutamate synthesis protein (capsule biosynthesis protein)
LACGAERPQTPVVATDLLLTGDINCKDDGLLSADPLARIADELASADIRIGNLEGAFHDPAVALPYKPGWYHCEPEMLSRITGHVDAVACANNVHFGEAIAPSLRRLDDAGIPHSGAGENLAAARRPAIVDRGGVTVGLLSYTSVFWPLGHAATEHSPGVAVVRVRTAYQPHPRLIEMPGAPAVVRSQPEAEDLETVCEDVARLRQQVDVVLVYCHWGVTGMDEAAEYQQLLGRAAIDAGADIVAGSHPHVPQGIELYGSGVILYSLGNFMFGWKLHAHMTSDGLLARVQLRPGQPWALSFVPVGRTEAGQIVTHAPDSPDGRRIGGRVAELSQPFGTLVAARGDRFVVSRAGGGDAFGRRPS